MGNLLSTKSSLKRRKASKPTDAANNRRAFSHKRQNPSTTSSKLTTFSSFSSKHSKSHSSLKSYSSNSSYHYIDGRRFLDNCSYQLPNDDEEIDRLTVQHYIARSILRSNYCAPVFNVLKNGAKVLDVGCGPGTWLLDMATEFPSSKFFGIDISNMYPQEIKPPNVYFEEADLLEGLPFDDNTFDFVVMRNMVSALKLGDWENKVLQELIRVCKPGGYIESTEFEIPGSNRGPMSTKLCDAWIEIMKTKNIDLTISTRLDQLYRSHKPTSLDLVTHITRQVPIGAWGDRIGSAMADDLIMLSKAVQPVLVPAWGVTHEQYDEYLGVLKREFDEYKSYCNIHVVSGRKRSENIKKDNV
ncbi:3997_t:CDS:2 [Acaulospora morrowiae]|uniref:3997_t:CDS:1 n=1 Tax=Acaulospora morrowiae TaxID=94023 RepID=A0A9N9FVD4_9GLOM|nr:3997_t:CDS:2 [Acaulospora morrowiae]